MIEGGESYIAMSFGGGEDDYIDVSQLRGSCVSLLRGGSSVSVEGRELCVTVEGSCVSLLRQRGSHNLYRCLIESGNYILVIIEGKKLVRWAN